MQTNFDFLKEEKDFDTFADVAISAEKLLKEDTSLCVLNCRRAMEFAVKWMYSVDSELVMPYQDNLDTLIKTREFRDIVDDELQLRLNYIRKCGNIAAHSGKKISEDQAKLCLLNLWYFMDFIAYCYAANYKQGTYDKSLLEQTQTSIEHNQSDTFADIDLKSLIEENKALKTELSSVRDNKISTYKTTTQDLSEFKTRKIYIDTMLSDIGWIENKDWLDEYKVMGMPNTEGVGFVDYVLLGDDGIPLGLIEAKRTSKDVAVGRQQANLYADLLEKQFGRRPVIFLSNGFEHRIIDGRYPERPVGAIYSKRDLQKLFNLRIGKQHLTNILVDPNIADRYYQTEAIHRVCESFDKDNKRRALLVMATGSGKTRTIIALVDVLLKHGWIKNVLFLADRNPLVTQAKRAFTNLLPNFANTNLVESKCNYNANCVFSTYQTMIHCIDDVSDDKGKLYTSGHFDLIVIDEAHRSIYNKYKDIFDYFDAPLVGLTATPKDEVDKNTYDIFGLESGNPTFGYELSQAVEDKYLVPYVQVSSPLKFVNQGILYSNLSEEEKAVYEDTFENEDGSMPEEIESSAMNTWVFNKNTVIKALDILWQYGLKIESGEKLGKTIIFAKNHEHAEFILKCFNEQYPTLPNYAAVIDNHINYSQSLIDQFSDPNKLPQIAISVDMLDTGIDVPEILNLVFFKPVFSKSKFWQMIGRGTRTCRGLLDGEDKKEFYIFDLCSNFEFFGNGNGIEVATKIALQGAMFVLKARICSKLQDISMSDWQIALRNRFIDEMVVKVKELNQENFSVRQHLREVIRYSEKDAYKVITFEDTLLMDQEVAPLLLPDQDDPSALRFDYLIYEMMYMGLIQKDNRKYLRQIKKKTRDLAKLVSIPQVMAQKELIKQINQTDILERAGLEQLEDIRIKLRDLIKYIPDGLKPKYITDFDDDFISVDFKPAVLEDELENYRKAAEFYLKAHEDNASIAKLRNNEPLTKKDLSELEHILWKEIGTKDDYIKEFADKPLGEFVRSIVGLDSNAAKKAFSTFINEHNLDSNQIYFVNQVIEYFIRNGVMSEMDVLGETPFTDLGDISSIFTNMNTWYDLLNVIDSINDNANIKNA